jgi:hypothetical protein
VALLRTIAAGVVLAVCGTALDSLLAERSALYRRWFDRRRARRRRRRRESLQATLRRRVGVAVVFTGFLDALRQLTESSRPVHLNDPEEAARMLSEQVEDLRTRSYADLCEPLRASLFERVAEFWFGAFIGGPGVRSTQYGEQRQSPSGTVYALQTRIQRKRVGGPVEVRVLVTQVGVHNARLVERFELSPAAG